MKASTERRMELIAMLYRRAIISGLRRGWRLPLDEGAYLHYSALYAKYRGYEALYAKYRGYEVCT